MDFHSLSRRELQALCKKNKIPANMTNVAMADALASLEKVEGLDEFIINASKSDDPHQKSPEKARPGSPEIPRTAGRTTTAARSRKPINLEPEGSGFTTRTRSRRTIRRTVIAKDACEEEDNKDASLLDTPAVPATRRRRAESRAKTAAQVLDTQDDNEEKSLAPLTPAAAAAATKSCRRRATTEAPVQRVYSTRRSVRLLEKSMADLSLKEPQQFEVGDKDVMPGADVPTGPEGSVKTNVSDVVPCPNIIEALDNARDTDMKHQLEEEKKSSDGISVYNSESVEKEEEDDNTSDALNLYQPENSVSRRVYADLESSHNDNGNGACFNKSELLSDAVIVEISDEHSVGPEMEGLDDNQDSLVAEAADDISALGKEQTSVAVGAADSSSEIMDQVLAPQSPPSYDGSSKMSSIEVEQHGEKDFLLKVAIEEDSGAEQSSLESKFAKSIQKEDPPSEVEYNVEALVDVKVIQGEEFDKTAKDSQSLLGSDKIQICPLPALVSQVEAEGKTSLPDMQEHEHSEALMDVEVVESESFGRKAVDRWSEMGSDKIQMSPLPSVLSSGEAEGESPLPEMQEQDNFGTSADILRMPADELVVADHPALDKSPNSVTKMSSGQQVSVEVADEIVVSPLAAAANPRVQLSLPAEGEIPLPETQEQDNFGASADILRMPADELVAADHPTLDKSPNSVTKMSSGQQVSVEVPDETVVSPLAAAATPRVQLSLPAESTLKKSSPQKETTVVHASDINKENIDNSGREVQAINDKANKRATNEEISTDISLRKLTKMLREKLQITNKDIDEKQVLKSEKSRPALKPMPENRLEATELEN